MWTVSRVVMMCIPRRLPQVIVLVGVLLFSAQMSRGKPFDPEIHTFSGQVKNSHAVIFVERGPEAGPTYRVLEVHKDDLQITKVGAEIRLDIESGIPAGGTGLILVADDDEGRHWNPWPLSRSGWEYVCMLPEGESTGAERAAHFAPYLAHDDQLIARDALFHASQLELPLVAKHVDDAMHVRMSELVAGTGTAVGV